MRIRTATTIEDIGREAWDALAGEEIFANYGWLLTLEQSQRVARQPAYWWIEDGQGIVAAVAARLRDTSPPAWNIDRSRYGWLAYAIRPMRKLLQRRPTLVCGAQMAQGMPILVRPGIAGSDYATVAARVLDAIEGHCRAQGWNLIFRGVVEPGEDLRAAFGQRPYIVGAEWPGTVMDIHWDSMGEYLLDLKTTHPTTEKGIRLQRNRGRRAGIVIEEMTDPAPYEAELYRIMAEHHTRKNRNPFYMGPRFTTVLKENLGDRAVFIVARKEGRIVGFSIHMRNSPAMSLKFVGIDESSVKSRDAVYFNVTYHELIERACALGCRQLYLGILTYEPKVRRGARLVPTSSWIWHPRPVRRVLMRGFLTAQARWQRRVLRKWLDMNRTAQDLPCYQWPPRPRGGGD